MTEQLGGLHSMGSQKSQTQLSGYTTTVVSDISFRYARKSFSYAHTCIFFFKLFSHLDYCRVLSRIPYSVYFGDLGWLLFILVIFVWFLFYKK